jgi:putative salt-induced outer membrane protein YdiY
MIGRSCLWLLVLFVAWEPAVSADTDVVIFENGDRLTGELKSLERGKLRFKTDATGTISIEWDKVAYLRSDQNVQVETSGGQRYLGRLMAAQNTGTVVVSTAGGSVELDAITVVMLEPIEERGINRLDGSVTAGYTFAKASSVEQVQFGLDLAARSEFREIRLSASSVQSDSEDSEASQRNNLRLSYVRLRPNQWFGFGNVNFDSNDELNLDLRTSFGAGLGRYLKQTNTVILGVGVGLQVSRENYTDGTEENNDTVEGVLAVNWDWFRYDTPELDLSTSLRIFPNLSDTGRVRGELDIRLKWEIIEDLFWQLSFYDSFDSDPAVDDTPSNDYGITTSLGWQF